VPVGGSPESPNRQTVVVDRGRRLAAAGTSPCILLASDVREATCDEDLGLDSLEKPVDAASFIIEEERAKDERARKKKSAANVSFWSNESISPKTTRHRRCRRHCFVHSHRFQTPNRARGWLARTSCRLERTEEQQYSSTMVLACVAPISEERVTSRAPPLPYSNLLSLCVIPRTTGPLRSDGTASCWD